ncbi:hypothetical protein A2303_07310 [Candidatus Falkowbacteria bacterium RIFOXYB2_FULL_47_14]|uniref:Uncharacterized protein n=1 Tax=Candidatus Falkowbacteria bacterium RIFOXYA2_FULL_47_19 TaxID=1797994 RepID=A0A1F5SGN0_9BACT|nr:MAG: hypothetical protein A2227_01055 [Candidatus Falkowbacteria bacterium RIFOXYA2_FULL_47_19]OGF34954.1 MAG: hypothetical protein A2468_07015 [Candidatus Falkowbacteria bacterium RIFOXYC2_FULL_46_15]OGF43669.1 MAG: hypothetical protein A2303_07310 [Candidatus Falkowbacteria bacterium RIFOXYB2_FULL_47_14]
MENNLQSKDGQNIVTPKDKKLTVFFVVVLVLNLLMNISLLLKKYSTYLLDGYCGREVNIFLNNFSFKYLINIFTCFDIKFDWPYLLILINVIVVIIFSLKIIFLWKKNNDFNRQKKLFIFYITGSIIIFILYFLSALAFFAFYGINFADRIVG